MNAQLSDIATALTGSLASDGQTPIVGPFLFEDGTFAFPGITFRTDQDEGFYRPGEGQIGFALAGTAGFVMNLPSATVGAGLVGTGSAVLCPIGVVQDFAGSTAPTGWFLCYGQSFDPVLYPELYAVIGTTYGGTASVPLLPDLRGCAVAGKDNMGGSARGFITSVVTPNGTIVGTTLGSVGGEQTHVLTTAELATHLHSITDVQHTHTFSPVASVASTTGGLVSGGASGGNATTIQSAFSGITATNNAGSNTAHNTLQPTVIMNKIIFAGRA